MSNKPYFMLLSLENAALVIDAADGTDGLDKDTNTQCIYWLLSHDLLRQGAHFDSNSFQFLPKSPHEPKKNPFGNPSLNQSYNVVALTDKHNSKDSECEKLYSLEIILKGERIRAHARGKKGGVLTGDPTIKNK